MKLDLGKIFFLILFLTLSVMAATAGTIKGTITDRQTKEPLTGATVQVSGTAQGAVADLDGNYTLELKNGTYTLTVRYIGYKDMTINAVEIKGETVLNFDMEPDTQTLGEVQVTAKKNLEGERALQMERRKATLNPWVMCSSPQIITLWANALCICNAKTRPSPSRTSVPKRCPSKASAMWKKE